MARSLRLSPAASPWWRRAVGYEIYLRSFSDSNGDGVGDLPGVRERLDYLSWLGIDTLWLTPFFPSPMHDQGYDVADYRDIDRTYGTLDDFDRLLADAHRLGIRVLVDLIPNHTSIEHRWFRESRSSRDNAYRNYYVWREPEADGGPPNNWVSVFGGPAWTLDDATGEYWLHLFLSEQPDLNWAEPRVAEEFDEILRFWLERGADGFRIDVADALLKHPALPDNPPATGPWRGPPAGIASDWGTLEHLYDVHQPGLLEIHRRWRRLAEPYGALLVGEIGLADPTALTTFVSGQDGLDLCFWFEPMEIEWQPEAIRAALATASTMSHDVAWVQGSHDRPRAATRFGGGELGRARSLALAVLLLGLPGMPFLYQGEELGLEEGVVLPEEAQDPISRRAGEHALGRDGCRTPMPWQPGRGLGFTSAKRAWLPFGGRKDADTVAVQRADPASTLHRYRRLLRVRRELPDAGESRLEWLASPGSIVAYRRGHVLVAANCGEEHETMDLPPGMWILAYDTSGSGGGAAVSPLALQPNTAQILVAA
ncbi:MAG: DUF3459 domain-containing protein [Actinobacteria bacterium]|nr:DUF3459 domain-containing protein [Actinomycetota bacterium]